MIKTEVFYTQNMIVNSQLLRMLYLLQLGSNLFSGLSHTTIEGCDLAVCLAD